MSINRARWDWLVQTYNTLGGDARDAIIRRMAARKGSSVDDEALHEIMTEMGIAIRGEDPDPPKKVYATDAGAEEYEEVMQCISIGKP
jgi:hypothetical protein